MFMFLATVSTVWRSMQISGGRQNYRSLSHRLTLPIQPTHFTHVKNRWQSTPSQLFQFGLNYHLRTDRLFQMKMSSMFYLVHE